MTAIGRASNNFTSADFDEFANALKGTVEDDSSTDEKVRLYLNSANAFKPEATSSSRPDASMHRLAALVRAGRDSPTANRIADLVVRSNLIKETTPSPEDVAIFCTAAAAFAPFQHEEAAPAQTAPEPMEIDLSAIKEELGDAAPSLSSLVSKKAPVLGAPLGAALVLGLGAIGALLLGPAGFAISAGLALVAGASLAVSLIGLAVIAGMALFQRKKVNAEMAHAQTPQEIAAMFGRLGPEAQVHYLDRLGPNFRKLIVEKNPNDTFLRNFAALFDVLESPRADEELKEKTYDNVLKLWNLDVDRFDAFIDRAQQKAERLGAFVPPS